MGSESFGRKTSPQEKIKELTGPEAELQGLVTQREQLGVVMQSLKMERSSISNASAETRNKERSAQEVSDRVITDSLSGGEISPEGQKNIINAESETSDAREWEDGLKSNRSEKFDNGDTDPYKNAGNLIDGPFKEKLASLGVNIDAVDRRNSHLYENKVEQALYDRDQELVMKIREKTLEVPGGKQKLVTEMLKGQNGPMSAHASTERASLVKRAKQDGSGASIAELYKSINPDRTYPLEARKEALGFIARATVRDMGGSPDSGESLAKALGEYAEADAAVHDKPYLEGGSSLDYVEREQTLERAREQSKLLQELSNTMSSIGEGGVVVSSFPGTLPSFFEAGTNEVIAQTDDGYDGRRKHGFPQEVKGLFENQETLSGTEVAERLKPLIESVQQELQGAEAAQEEREEAERKIEELGSKKIGQDLTVA